MQHGAAVCAELTSAEGGVDGWTAALKLLEVFDRSSAAATRDPAGTVGAMPVSRESATRSALLEELNPRTSDPAAYAAVTAATYGADPRQVLDVLEGNASSSTLPPVAAAQTLRALHRRHGRDAAIEAAAGDRRNLLALPPREWDLTTGELDAAAQRVLEAGGAPHAAAILDQLDGEHADLVEVLMRVLSGDLDAAGLSGVMPLRALLAPLSYSPLDALRRRVVELPRDVQPLVCATLTVAGHAPTGIDPQVWCDAAALATASWLGDAPKLLAHAASAGVPALGDGSLAEALGDPTATTLTTTQLTWLVTALSDTGRYADAAAVLCAATRNGEVPHALWSDPVQILAAELPVAVLFALVAPIATSTGHHRTDNALSEVLDVLIRRPRTGTERAEVFAAMELHPTAATALLRSLPAMHGPKITEAHPGWWLAEESMRRCGLAPWMRHCPPVRRRLLTAADGVGIDRWTVLLSLADQFNGTPAELVELSATLTPAS